MSNPDANPLPNSKDVLLENVPEEARKRFEGSIFSISTPSLHPVFTIARDQGPVTLYDADEPHGVLKRWDGPDSFVAFVAEAAAMMPVYEIVTKELMEDVELLLDHADSLAAVLENADLNEDLYQEVIARINAFKAETDRRTEALIQKLDEEKANNPAIGKDFPALTEANQE